MQELGTVVRQGRIYLIATLAGRASAFGLLPLFGYMLSPAEFGVMALLIMFNELLGMLARMGMLQAMMRLFFDDEDEAHRHRVVATAQVLTLTACLLIVLAAWPLGQILVPLLQIEGYALAATYALLMLAATMLFSTASNVFMLRKQPGRLVWTNGIKSVLVFSLTATALVVFDGGVAGVMLAQAVATGIIALGLTALEARRSGLWPNRAIAVELLRFGLPLVPSAFANAAVQAVDRYILNVLVGPAAVGPYALAGRLGHMLQHFVARPLSQVLFVRRYETLAAEQDQGEFHSLQVLYLAVLLLGALGLGLFGPEMVWLLAAPAYAPAGPIVGLIGLAFAAAALNQSLEMGLLYAKRTHLVSIIAVVMLVVSAPVYWVMITWQGVAGAAAGFLMLNLLRMLITDRLNAHFGTPLVRQNWRRSLALMGLAGGTYAGAMATFGGAVSGPVLAAKAGLFAAVAGLVLAGPFLEAATRTALWDLVRRRRLRASGAA